MKTKFTKEQIELYIKDYSVRGGENDEPLPYDQQPIGVQMSMDALKEFDKK